MKIFKEEQRFTQTWLMALLAVSAIVPLVLISKEYFKDKSMTLQEYLTTLAIVLVSLGFIFLFKLKTRIDEFGVHYQFFPFHLSFRKIAWSEITKAEVRNYDAITEFGGWGLKGGVLWKKSKGVAYNVSGDIGLQLELTSGKKILIGTQEKEAMQQVINTYQDKITQPI